MSSPHDAPHKGLRGPRQTTAARRARLADILHDRGETVSVHDLTALFDVSESTLRRDLDALSRNGELIRTYGGATPAHQQTEFSWREKALTNAAAKNHIARLAASELVHSGDVVFIDAGTTPAAVARCLADREDITVVVAGLAALLELADSRCPVIVLGGRLRRPSVSFLGNVAGRILDMVTPDVAFLGTDHVDPHYGINYADIEQAAFKAAVLERSARSWVVADSSKLEGPPPFAHWAALGHHTGIVTSRPTDKAQSERIAALRQAGYNVLVAETDTDVPSQPPADKAR